MNLHRLCLALGAAGLLLASPLAGSAERSRDFSRSGPSGLTTGPGRVIVTYRQTMASAMSARIQSASQGSSPLREAQTLNQRHGLDLRDGRTIAPGTQVLTSATLSNERLLKTLAADPDVVSVTIDQWRHPHAAPNDPLYANGQAATTPTAGQWYLRAPSGTVVSSINAEGAWNTTTGSSGIVVAVLDTGVRPEHPDLMGKLLPGFDFVHTIDTANDGDVADGDASDPGDWVSVTDKNSSAFSTCTVTNSSWHGTQTAAVIGAATNNGSGMASVGRNVRLLPVRVLGKCGGYDSDIIAGMRWAAGLAVTGAPTNPTPARVLNLSLGSSGSCETGTSSSYTSTIATLNGMGVVVVASAGNDDLAVNAPGNCPGAIAVAGLRHAGSKSGFSSLGTAVALAAPAGNCVTETGICQYPIITATNTGTTTPVSSSYSSGLGDVSLGTSFSAPMVAGTAALMLSANPSLTAAEVRSLLTSTTRAFPTTGGSTGIATCTTPGTTKQEECYCTTSTCGAGMLDTQAAVQAAATGRAVAHLGGAGSLVTTGNSVTIDGSGSTAASGASLTTYLWELIDGSSLATITSANNASSVTLSTASPTTSGMVTVRLTVTDNLGNTGFATQAFTLGTATSIVTAVPTSTATTTPSNSGGGGGAFDLSWAALGLLSVMAAWRRRQARSARA